MGKELIFMPDKKLPYNAEDGRELFDNLFAVASTTECTGLIPAAPEEARRSHPTAIFMTSPWLTIRAQPNTIFKT